MKLKLITSLLLGALLLQAALTQAAIADDASGAAGAPTPDASDNVTLVTLDSSTEPTVVELSGDQRRTIYERQYYESTCYRDEVSHYEQDCETVQVSDCSIESICLPRLENRCSSTPVYHSVGYACTESVDVAIGEVIENLVHNKTKLEVRIIGEVGTLSAQMGLKLANGSVNHYLDKPAQGLLVFAKMTETRNEMIPALPDQTYPTRETENTLVITLIEQAAIAEFFKTPITSASITRKGKVSFTLKNYLPLGLPENFFNANLELSKRARPWFPVIEDSNKSMADWKTTDGFTYNRELTELRTRFTGRKVGIRRRMNISLELAIVADNNPMGKLLNRTGSYQDYFSAKVKSIR